VNPVFYGNSLTRASNPVYFKMLGSHIDLSTGIYTEYVHDDLKVENGEIVFKGDLESYHDIFVVYEIDWGTVKF
jgi:hypothetical protein